MRRKEYALIGYRDSHVEAAILLSVHTKGEIVDWKEDCKREGITRFEMVPANGLRLISE